MRAITTNLKGWEPAEAIERAEAVRMLEDHPGLLAIYDAIEQRKLELVSQLLTRAPSDMAADKERLIGLVAGFEEFPRIIQGIIDNGRKAESLRREEE